MRRINMKRIRKMICGWLAVAVLVSVLYVPGTGVQAATGFTLKAANLGNVNGGKGGVSLDWTSHGSSGMVYKGYQSKDGGKSWQSISLMDFSRVTTVRVLNVYPDKGDNLKAWMENNGYGKGIIKVDKVSITSFNGNPSAYLKKDGAGNWNYEVVFFGSWDSNNFKDLNASSYNVTRSFANEGGGVILGHDTLCNYPADGVTHPYFNKFYGDLNLRADTNFNCNGVEKYGSNKVKVMRVSLLTNYPWNLGGVGTEYTIPTSHTMFQSLNDTSAIDFQLQCEWKDQRKDLSWYLTTRNNFAMVQTGHSNGEATADEQKILANTIFYCCQKTSAKSMTDYSAMDYAKPDKPSAQFTDSGVQFTAKDNGSEYRYYVQAFNKSNLSSAAATSNTAVVNAATGIKGYYYVGDNNASNNFSLQSAKYTTGTISRSSVNGTYLHVKAVDYAGNVSDVADIPNHYKLVLNPNGGAINTQTGAVTASDLVYGQTNMNSVSAYKPVREGYTFTGWYTAVSGGTKVYDSNGACTSAYFNGQKYKGTSNLTLYAQWQVNYYYFDLNAVLDGVDASNTGGFGTADIYIDGKAVRSGVEDGYLSAKYGSTYEIKNIKASKGHVYRGSRGALTGKIGVNRNAVYLIFDTKTIDVTFHRSINAEDAETTSQTYTYGADSQNLPVTGWSKTGYSFAGWSRVKNPSTSEYKDQEAVTGDWIDQYYPKTDMYGVWKANSYTVHFDYNKPDTADGTVAASETKEKTVTYDSSYGSLPAPTLAHWSFDGWFTDSGEKVTSDTQYQTDSDTTLHAHWTIDTFDLTIHASVLGNMADKADDYSFRIKFSGKNVPDMLNVSQASESKTASMPEYTFSLSNGNEITFQEVPYGTHYEIAVDAPEYLVMGAVSQDVLDTTTATVKLWKGITIPTSADQIRVIAPAVMMITAVSVIICIRRKKKSKQKDQEK